MTTEIKPLVWAHKGFVGDAGEGTEGFLYLEDHGQSDFMPLYGGDEFQLLKRDAERYRKLRDEFSWTLASSPDGSRLSVHMPGVFLTQIGPDSDEFDVAVDTARASA